MTPHAEIKASEAITRETITTALDNDGLGTVPFHDITDGWLKYALVRDIIDAISKREVHRIILALSNTDVTKLTSSGKVFSVFMEGDGHNTIGRVEGLFDTITMVDININVQHSLPET